MNRTDSGSEKLPKENEISTASKDRYSVSQDIRKKSHEINQEKLIIVKKALWRSFCLLMIVYLVPYIILCSTKSLNLINDQFHFYSQTALNGLFSIITLIIGYIAGSSIK